MSNLVGRKITYARFHQSLFFPDTGALGDVLPSPSKTLEMNLEHAVEGILVKLTKGRTQSEILVPWGNVVAAKYDTSATVINFPKSAA